MTEMKEPKVIHLYLETWQTRMLRDYVKGLKIRVSPKIIIDFTRPVHLNTYRVAFKDPREEGIEVYFTDAQKAYLQEVTGLKTVDSMRLNKAMIDSKAVMF